MNKTDETWKEHLVRVGEAIFHSSHSKALNELSPEGKFSEKEWNEATSTAILEAVAAMILENNTAH